MNNVLFYSAMAVAGFGFNALVWMMIPAGQEVVGIEGNSHTIVASTETDALMGRDFKAENMASGKITGVNHPVPYRWKTMKGFGWGSRAEYPSAQVFSVSLAEETITATIEVDTRDNITIKVPLEMKVRPVDPNTFIIQSFEVIPEEQQDAVKLSPSIAAFFGENGPGNSILQAGLQKVYVGVPLSELNQTRSVSEAASKQAVSDMLQNYGLEVVSLAYTSGFGTDKTISEALRARVTAQSDLDLANGELSGATALKDAQVARLRAYGGDTELALRGQCSDLVDDALETVVRPLVEAGRFSDVKATDSAIAVPNAEKVADWLGCEL